MWIHASIHPTILSLVVFTDFGDVAKKKEKWFLSTAVKSEEVQNQRLYNVMCVTSEQFVLGWEFYSEDGHAVLG